MAVGVRQLAGTPNLKWFWESREKHHCFPFPPTPPSSHCLSLPPHRNRDRHGSVWQNTVINKAPIFLSEYQKEPQGSWKESKERVDSGEIIKVIYELLGHSLAEHTHIWPLTVYIDFENSTVLQSLWKTKLCWVNLLKRHNNPKYMCS